MKRGVGRETAEQCAPTALSAVSPADLPPYDYQPVEEVIGYSPGLSPDGEMYAAVLIGLLAAIVYVAVVLA